MTQASLCDRHLLTAACRGIALAAALGAATSLARANDYDESTRGDLADSAGAPTNIGGLTAGSNRIAGSTIPSGTFNPITHSLSIIDNDYVTFSVPAGYILSDLVLASDSSIQPTDRLFMGIAKGSTVSVDPSFSSASGLLGWTLVGASMVGSDLLPFLGVSAPPNFQAVPGATGFNGPLGSGQYTLWLVDGDQPVVYDLRLNLVPAVPEPSNSALLLAGIGAGALGLKRRLRRKADGS